MESAIVLFREIVYCSEKSCYQYIHASFDYEMKLGYDGKYIEDTSATQAFHNAMCDDLDNKLHLLYCIELRRLIVCSYHGQYLAEFCYIINMEKL